MAEQSIRNRVALLITNRNFTDTRLNRYGAEKDEENMERLLTALRYEVVKYSDLTGKVLLKLELPSTSRVTVNQ